MDESEQRNLGEQDAFDAFMSGDLPTPAASSDSGSARPVEPEAAAVAAEPEVPVAASDGVAEESGHGHESAHASHSQAGHSEAGHSHAGHSHAGHSHGPHRWLDFPLDATGRLLATAAGVALLIALIGTVVLWPSGDAEVPQVLSTVGVDRYTVEVTEVVTGDCYGAPSEIPCDTISFLRDDGVAGVYTQTNSEFTSPVAVGDRVVVADQAGLGVENEFRYYFLDFDRDAPLYWLAVLFAAAVIGLGRSQGVRSLVALLASFVILATFTLPALLDTDSPVLVAIVGSAGVAAVTFYLTHGITHLSTVALLGSLTSLTLTGVLAWIFVPAANLTGLSSEDSLFLIAGNAEINIQGILLAGMIIGTVGVLDDVTITQASAVAEIHAANPAAPSKRIYDSALRVGRDHIGSTTNTLVFAYAGASLPLLMLLTQAQLSLGDALTSETIAIEIVRSLVGGIGLIASVPITTALATWVVRQSAASPAEKAAAAD